MRRTKAVAVGDLVRLYLRQEGLETPLNERRLIDAWPQVTGPMVEHYTGNMFIKNGILFVHLTSAALRQELTMNRQTLVGKLNAAVGASVITNIVFR